MEQGSNGNGKADKVQDAVRVAHDELRTLLQQRAELTKRIGTVKQNIAVLANMFGEGALNEDLLRLLDRRVTRRQSGFTNACRLALMESRNPLTAREVCGHVQQKAAAVLKKHKDPLASVTTVLNRLVDYGEARSVTNQHGKRAFLWVAEEVVEPRRSTLGAMSA
jgi:hypothetical protein